MTTPPEPTADVSNLVHLFADRFAPRARGKGPLVFSRTDATVAVDRNQLAITLIVASIWGLRESGLTRVEQRQDKKLGFVKLDRTHMWAAGDGQPRGDLERRVLTVIREKAGSDGVSEYQLVRSIVPTVDEPYGWVVGTVINDDVAQGYLTKNLDAGGRLIGFIPVTERIDQLGPAAADLAERWNKFCDTEPEMIKPLRSHIDTALHGKIERNNDDYDYD